MTMEVFSGGQPGKGEGGARVGSVRHDHGGAADAFFYKDGRKLDWSNKDDIPIFQQIVSQGKANGITGFGAGDGYMQKGSMHIGMGSPGVWGAGGKGDNAAPWLRSAFEGTAFDPNSVTAVAQSSGGSSAASSMENDPAVQALQAQAVARAQGPQPASQPAPQQTAAADAKKADEPLIKLPKIFPDKIMGVDTKKGLNVFGALGDMMAKQDQASNQQIQAAAQAGAARRQSAPPVQVVANPAPLFAATGGSGQIPMGTAEVEELKKKLLMQRLGGLGGLGGFGRV